MKYPIKEVERFRADYNPAIGTYKMVSSNVGERVDPLRLASLRPIKRFSGTRRSLAKGGVVDDVSTGSLYSRFSHIKYDKGGKLLKTLDDVAPYISNITNAFRDIPAPVAPMVETPINPNLVNYDAARGQIDQDYASFAGETDLQIPHRGVAQAVKANALGKKILGKNMLAQQEQNTNAFIKNQTNQQNQEILGRNIERFRNYNDQVVGRNIAQQRVATENIADATEKYLLGRRDKDMMALEGRKLDVQEKAYRDTGVYERNLSEEKLDELRALYPGVSDDVLKRIYGVSSRSTSSAYPDPTENKYGGKLYQIGGPIIPPKKKLTNEELIEQNRLLRERVDKKKLENDKAAAALRNDVEFQALLAKYTPIKKPLLPAERTLSAPSHIAVAKVPIIKKYGGVVRRYA